MKMTAEEYARRVKQVGPRSPLGSDCLWAFCVVSAAIEFKPEGRVCGTGAKMFTIAGPVIVYGTLAAVVYGGVLWLLGG